MKISQIGVDLIKSFEGCSLKSYLCPANVWTIGYGSTKNVKQGQVITQKEAEELLKNDLVRYEKAVNDAVKVDINQNQYDALVSFTYNCGIGALQKSTLLKRVNQKDFKSAALEFAKWNKGGGKILKGLVRRREAEIKLFNTLEKSTKTTIVPKVVKTPVYKTYTVQKGDNLTHISKAYGVKVEDLVKLNGLKNANEIKIGQILKIYKK